MRLYGLAACALAWSVGGTAQAQDYRGVAFAGASLGQGNSAYVGAVASLPGASLGRGLAVRGTAIAGNYRYAENGTSIRGRYRGGEAALVYQLSGNFGWSNLSVGPRVTKTSLSPADPKNELQGTRWDLGLQADGAFNLDPQWRLTYLGSFGVKHGAYLARAAVGRLVNREKQTRIGVEGTIQGDPAYNSRSAGVFASTQIAKATEIQLSAGIRDQEARKPGAYVGFGGSFLF